jgi:energy-coupling factor transport system ATP-binding protein
LRDAGQLPEAPDSPGPARTVASRRRRSRPPAALELHGVWHELRSGPVILRDVSLRVLPGERVALMGRNGAGKSTLLRHAAGLLKPTRGRVTAAGRVGLLLQNPNDYLVHDRVADEAPAPALVQVGLDPVSFAERHPRDLSGGERQRLALAVVLGDEADAAAALCLDEPTRGMDRGDKAALARLLAGLPGSVVVATHDPEFAAGFADRVILLADGAVIADGPVGEVLAGGTYFATETARILGGWNSILTPEEAVATLARPRAGIPVQVPTP